MKQLLPKLMALVLVIGMLAPSDADAQVRRRIARVRHPRVAFALRAGHPLRRAMPAQVVVRAARHPVLVTAPIVFLPAMVWTAAVVSARPSREHLVFEDSETIDSDDGWVDTNYGIDATGNALFLEIQGKAHLNFAEVTFANGNVQVVDFNEKTHDSGMYKLLDFADGRNVKTVRILAESKSEETKLSVFLSK